MKIVLTGCYNNIHIKIRESVNRRPDAVDRSSCLHLLEGVGEGVSLVTWSLWPSIQRHALPNQCMVASWPEAEKKEMIPAVCTPSPPVTVPLEIQVFRTLGRQWPPSVTIFQHVPTLSGPVPELFLVVTLQVIHPLCSPSLLC